MSDARVGDVHAHEESIDYSEYEEPPTSSRASVRDSAAHSSNTSGLASPSRNGANKGAGAGAGMPASSRSSSFTLSEDDAAHVHTIEAAMLRLRQLQASEDWTKTVSHEKGVTVHVAKSVVEVKGKSKKVPLFRGELFIDGFAPEQVFEVVGNRSLWDDWYDSGNLVADLNNSTSMTYMNMHIPGTARPRDVSLIERVEVSQDSTIWFATTSIESNKVPQVHGRTRAHMVLNGWVLKPFTKNDTSPGTWCYYYLQVDPSGLTPNPLASKIISKRLAHIYKINDYLKSHGVPRAAGTGQRSAAYNEGTPNGHAKQVNGVQGAGALAGAGQANKPQTSTSDEADGSALPPQAPADEKHSSFADLQKAKKEFEELLRQGQNGGWEKAVGSEGQPLFSMQTKDSTLPIMMGDVTLPHGYTTEQVLGTILSPSARSIWDRQIERTRIDEALNASGEQYIRTEVHKGIHPHLASRSYTLAQSVYRHDANSDNGDLTCIASTSKAIPSAPNGSSSHNSNDVSSETVDYSGWSITSSPSGDGPRVQRAVKHVWSQEVPDFVKRILIVAHAGAPAALSKCLQDFGHAPYFLRWTAGPWRLGGEIEGGSISDGSITWNIEKTAAAFSGQAQVAWLQYSSTMYPNGVSFALDSAKDGLTAARVNGFANTVQITLPSSRTNERFTLKVARHAGSGPEDIQWNGSRLQESVEPPKGTAGTRSRAPKKAVPAAAATAGSAPERGAQPSGSVPASDTRKLGGVSPPISPTSTRMTEQAKDIATLHHIPTNTQGRRELPDDAMLILTRDIYFTRSQMAIITTLLLFVYCLARFT